MLFFDHDLEISLWVFDLETAQRCLAVPSKAKAVHQDDNLYRTCRQRSRVGDPSRTFLG